MFTLVNLGLPRKPRFNSRKPRFTTSINLFNVHYERKPRFTSVNLGLRRKPRFTLFNVQNECKSRFKSVNLGLQYLMCKMSINLGL